MTKELITKVIKRRKFHDIPDWMIQRVDITIFMDLLHDLCGVMVDHIMGENIGYKFYPRDAVLEDTIEFLFQIRDAGNITPNQLAAAFTEHKPSLLSDLVYVLSYLLRDNDWKQFLHNVNLRSFIENRDWTQMLTRYSLIACKLHRGLYGKMPLSIIDKLLHTFDYWINHDMGDRCVHALFRELRDIGDVGYLPNVDRTIYESTGTKFIDEFLDIARERSSRYYWGSTIFDTSNIWNYQVPYLPNNFDYTQFIAYLWVMTNMPNCELSEKAISCIQDIVAGDDTDAQNVTFKSIFMLFDNLISANPNNIRFLMPFYAILEYRPHIDSLIQKMVSNKYYTGKTVKYHPLRDFTYFLPKEMNNDEIQKWFLAQGGDPNTLLSDNYDVDTYLRTADGISFAIMNCNPVYMTDVLTDDRVCSVLTQEIIGKVNFHPVIGKLVAIVETGSRSGRDAFHIIRLAINRHYPLVETASSIALPLLRISPIGQVEAAPIVERWPIAVFYISVFSQDAKTLLTGVRRTCDRNKYFPLYFGLFGSNKGIEDVFTLTEMISLLTINSAYFGDIRKEEIAELLYSHEFLWEN